MPRRLVKRRSAHRESSSHDRTRRTTKRPKTKESLVDGEIGDVIVVDTGIFEDTRPLGDTYTIGEAGTAGDTGTVEDNGTVKDTGTVKDNGRVKDTVTVEDENPKRTFPSDDSNPTQKARDALFVVEVAPDFAEKERYRLQNSIFLYIPPPDEEHQQSRITRPSTNTHQSASATFAHLHNAKWSPPSRDAPDDCQRPFKSAKLSSSSQELSPRAIPALKQCQPDPNILPVRDTEQSASEPSALRRVEKPRQSVPVAEGDYCSPKFSISGAFIGRQTSKPASMDDLPLQHTGVRYLGTDRNHGVSTRFRTEGCDVPDDPQASLQSPGQASRQSISAGEPWTGSFTSHHEQHAQQLRTLRSDVASKASRSQINTPVEPNEVQSSTGMTNTKNSICRATQLVYQPHREQNPQTSLPVSNFPGPALPLWLNPSNFAGIEATIPQVRSLPAQVNHVSHQLLKSIQHPSPSHHNTVWMDVITGVLDTSRAANDKKKLKDRAAELIAGREDVELEEDETTGGRQRAYPDACGAVVDRFSARGLVAITVRGISIQQVDTGQGQIGEPYVDLTIGVGQTCVIYGSSTVLYYKPRKVPAQPNAQPSQPGAAQPRKTSFHELVKLASSPSEIEVRLQMDELEKFSAPYEFSVWSHKIKTTEFFAWFGRQTGRGGVRGPPLLTFTLKDAMPVRKSRNIAILDEDDFRWMRKHIIREFDKAKLFMPGLKDFTVLVTDPGWSQSRRIHMT